MEVAESIVLQAGSLAPSPESKKILSSDPNKLTQGTAVSAATPRAPVTSKRALSSRSTFAEGGARNGTPRFSFTGDSFDTALSAGEVDVDGVGVRLATPSSLPLRSPPLSPEEQKKALSTSSIVEGKPPAYGAARPGCADAKQTSGVTPMLMLETNTSRARGSNNPPNNRPSGAPRGDKRVVSATKAGFIVLVTPTLAQVSTLVEALEAPQVPGMGLTVVCPLYEWNQERDEEEIRRLRAFPQVKANVACTWLKHDNSCDPLHYAIGSARFHTPDFSGWCAALYKKRILVASSSLNKMLRTPAEDKERSTQNTHSKRMCGGPG